MKLSARFFACLTLGTLLTTSALLASPAKLRYPNNLAWRLITEREIQRYTNCPERPGYEQQHALPLFSQPIAPFNEVTVAPNGQLPLEAAPKTWEVAPFPYIAPPKTDSGWHPAVAGTVIESQTPAPNQEQEPAASPAAFSDVSASESPAAALHPLPHTAGEQLLAPADRLPEPFSLRRYSTDEHGFFQIALYSGFSSINAEIAYKTLRTASPNRQAVSGLGSEAFLSLVTLTPPPDSQAENQRDKTLTPDSFDQEDQEMGFAAIAPEGSQRFDMTDPALIKTQSAPFFNDVPIEAANLRSTLPSALPEALRQTGGDEATVAGIREAETIEYPEAATGTVPDAPVADSLPQVPVVEAAPAPKSMDEDDDLVPTSAPGVSAEPQTPTSAWEKNAQDIKEEEKLSDPFSQRPTLEVASAEDAADAETTGTRAPQILVLIMHYPDKDAVVELAMDTRMGSLQSLIAMAYLVQGRLIHRW